MWSTAAKMLIMPALIVDEVSANSDDSIKTGCLE